MAYRSSPRPSFDRPTPIPYAGVTRYLWGDDAAGRVNDWIYVSSGKLHQLVFGFPEGAGFRHSESFRTVFGADEVLIVLSGRMVIANPETGEVRIAETGDAVLFHRDTWHNAWALPGAGELRVLEYFAPPPSTGTSGAYAQARPYLEQARYERAGLCGRWPEARAEAEAASHFTLFGPADRLWSLPQGGPLALTGLIASTAHLTAGEVRLHPGGRTGAQRHGGDAALYVAEGRVNVLAEGAEGTGWSELHPGDGYFVPEGFAYELWNMGSAPARVWFGAAPAYRPDGA